LEKRAERIINQKIMEELQDAIEDAQYVNAIATQEDGPRPVLPWEKPTEEQLEEWEVKNSHFDDFEWTIRSSAIAFFLFSSFIKTSKADYVRINFCEEVARFRKLRAKPKRDKADQILLDFLATPPPKPPPSEPALPEVAAEAAAAANVTAAPANQAKMRKSNTVELQASSASMNVSPSEPLPSALSAKPPRTEIDEYDLERTVPAWNVSVEEANKILELNMDWPECKESYVGLKGPLRKEIFQRVEEMREVDRIAQRGGSMDGTHINLMQMNRPMPSMSQSLRKAKRTTGDSLGEGKDDKSTSKTSREMSGESALSDRDDTEFASEELNFAAETAAAVSNSNSSDNAKKSPDPNNEATQTTDKKNMASSMHEMHSLRNLTKRLRESNNSTRDLLDDTIFDSAERAVMESLRREYWADFQQSPEFIKLKHFLWYQDRPVVPDDFFVMRVLGRGGFGLVTACKKGTSGKLYAMKVMNKRRIKMRRAEQLTLNERQALAAVESSFVVNLKYSFHSKDDVYLILDLMTGGDLGYHLHQKGRFPKRECQYYAARIMLGLQALHDKRYVYRDLKPENCLLADDGRVKISDLGLATKITPTLHGAAGTRGYWAPEMLRRDKKGRRMPYGHTVDWFSFGCCVAEFISGTNPFRSEVALNFGLERGMQTRERAIDLATREMEPEFSPEIFEPDAADLCRRLLDKNELTRLGSTGCEEIMAHPWFKNVNWESIISDRKRPPFVPAKDVNAASQSEIGTFAEDKAYQETVIEESDEEVYKHWDWTNPRAFAAEVIEFLIYERETGEPLVPITQHGTCCCDIL